MRFCLILVLFILFYVNPSQQGLLGSRRKLTRDEIHSDEFGQILSSAVNECNRYHQSEKWHRQETVSDATKQIVQGTNYEFNVRLRPTKCLKQAILDGTETATEDACQGQQDEPHIICSVAVWFRPWLKEKIEAKVRGQWRVASVKLSISEIQSSLTEQTELAQQFHNTVSHAVDMYNLEGKHKKILKYGGLTGRFRQSEEPGMLSNEVHLQTTDCIKITASEHLEISKRDPCYTTILPDFYSCDIQVTETLDNATITNCKLVSVTVGGLWRLTAHGPFDDKQGKEAPKLLGSPKPKPMVLKSHWSSEPLDLAFVSAHRDVPVEQLEDSKYKSLVRQLVSAYNARSNALFMYTLSEVKNVKFQEQPEETYKIKLRLQETECKKNKGYMDDVDRFEKDCAKLDMMKPVDECEMTASYTGKPNKPYNIHMKKCKRLNPAMMIKLGGKIPVDTSDRAKPEFQDLLQRVTEKFNAESDSGIIYGVDRAENVLQQVTSGQTYHMNVTFKAMACRLPSKGSCYEESEQHSYSCDVVVVQDNSGGAEETINISNCWRLVEKLTPIQAKWTTVDSNTLASDKFREIATHAVETYNKKYAAKETDWKLDYTDEVKKLTGTKELMSFILKMKNDKDKKMSCKVTMLSPYKNEDTIAFNSCKKYKDPVTGPGMPRKMKKSEVERSDFTELLSKATMIYNKEAENRYYHRLDRFEDPRTQVVSGISIEFKLHLQPTNCMKGKDKEHYEKQKYHLCGPVNITHVVVCDVQVWQQKWLNSEKIELKSCAVQRRNVTARGIVQTEKSSLLSKKFFQDMIKEAAIVLNTQLDNKRYYKKITVENITQQENDGNNKYTFELGLYSTKCTKDVDFVPFMEKRFDNCSGKKDKHVLHCRVTVLEKATPAGEQDVTVDSCLYAYPPKLLDKTKKRRLTENELNKPPFKQLEQQAVNLFNQSVESPVTYNVYNTENAVIHPDLGQKVSFDLYLKPSKCRPSKVDGIWQTVNETLCNQTVPLHFIQCHVNTWTRPWLRDSNLISIERCQLIYVNRTTLHLGALGKPEHSGVNMTYLNELVPRFVEMFNRGSNLSHTYEKETIENANQLVVAGQKLTFDLFLKPTLKSSNCSVETDSDTKCPKEDHFYYCKASVWSRPWLNSETLDLKECLKVHLAGMSLIGVPRPVEVKGTNLKLKDITERAIKLYNEKLSDDFVFGNGKVTDAVEQIVGGMLTKFNLRIEPVACKLNAQRKRCNAQDSRLRVECRVLFWERPWQEQSERIALEDCRRFYDDGTAANHEVRLSREEEQSEDFQAMLDQMAKLYQSDVPIIYEADKVLNARVKHDKVRNITFNIILTPSGCNQSLPGGNDPKCINWAEQDQVSCEGQISEHPTGYRTMSLRNCRVLWKTESERPLTRAEQASKWFRQSIRDAIQLYQSSVQSNKLYKLRSIQSGTLRRSDIEFIEYRMILAETDCVKGENDIWDDDECPEKENAVVQTCSVELKRKPDHSHDLSISC